VAQKSPKPPNTWTVITNAITRPADLLYVLIFFMFQFIAANACCLFSSSRAIEANQKLSLVNGFLVCDPQRLAVP